MAEREPKEKSVMKSRLFKGGAFVAVVSGIFGIGLLLELGAAAAAGGAGWTWAFGNPKKK